MNNKYVENVGLFKALTDTNRLMIVDMLSCGELCACGLVNGRKRGQVDVLHFGYTDNLSDGEMTTLVPGAWDKSSRRYIGKLKMERVHRNYFLKLMTITFPDNCPNLPVYSILVAKSSY